MAAISLSENPGEAGVAAACAVVADGLRSRSAYVLRAADPHFLRIGSSDDPTAYDIKQRGYWLMWQELARSPNLVAVAADTGDRLVKAVRPLTAGDAGNYVAMVLPGPERNSDMLVVDRGTTEPVTAEDECFLETARPILCQLIDKVFAGERREWQKRQLSALADVARAFNSAQSMEAALADLATAIANASGIDFVNVLIYDEALENVVDHGANVSRLANTETAAMIRGHRLRENFGQDMYGPLPRRMRRGLPFLIPDVFAPEANLPQSMRRYYERAHVNSVAWLPLVFQDRVLGTIDFTSSTKRDFDETELAFLSALAAQAATAVKGMLLYRDLERSKDELLRSSERLEEASRADHFMARTDAVTGIPNRRYLEEVLKAESARSSRYREPISVVMADLDYFKLINDQYGHLIGDEALRFVSQVARECSRTSDFVGRWGGDEFLFILPQTSADAAFVFADRFRRELAAKPFRTETGNQMLRIPISAGVADAWPPPAANSETLVSRADQALYDAKQSGRDRVCHWDAASAA
jgi:diguanylate cyclase (GGDEF)-like protein